MTYLEVVVKVTGTDPDFMLSLARGMATLRAFEGRAQLTIAQAASVTGLSRSSVRRCLHTLETLGYLREQGGRYRLAPTLLPLAHGYVMSDPLAVAAQPVVNNVRDMLGESCSLAVFEPRNRGSEVIYIARAEAAQPIAMPLHVGSALPAYCSSLGRVLLAALDGTALSAYLADAPFPARTPETLTSAEQVRAACDQARECGFSQVNEELEPGLRSIAVPVRSGAGGTVAALNVGVAAGRWQPEGMIERILPELRAAATHLARSIQTQDR